MGEKQGISSLFTSKEWANIMEIGRGVINRHFEAAQDVLRAQHPNTHADPFERQEQGQQQPQPEPMNDVEYTAYIANAELQMDEYAEQLHGLDAAAYAAKFLDKKQREQKEHESLEIDAEYWRLRAKRNAELLNDASFALDAANVELEYLRAFKKGADDEIAHLRKYKADADGAMAWLSSTIKSLYPAELYAADHPIKGAADLLRRSKRQLENERGRSKEFELKYEIVVNSGDKCHAAQSELIKFYEQQKEKGQNIDEKA